MTIEIADDGHPMEPSHVTLLIYGALPWALCPPSNKIAVADWEGRDTPRFGDFNE